MKNLNGTCIEELSLNEMINVTGGLKANSINTARPAGLAGPDDDSDDRDCIIWE